jgi:hypothetical protein
MAKVHLTIPALIRGANIMSIYHQTIMFYCALIKKLLKPNSITFNFETLLSQDGGEMLAMLLKISRRVAKTKPSNFYLQTTYYFPLYQTNLWVC